MHQDFQFFSFFLLPKLNPHQSLSDRLKSVLESFDSLFFLSFTQLKKVPNRHSSRIFKDQINADVSCKLFDRIHTVGKLLKKVSLPELCLFQLKRIYYLGHVTYHNAYNLLLFLQIDRNLSRVITVDITFGAKIQIENLQKNRKIKMRHFV